MIYLDPQGNDRTSEVGAYLARKSEENYRERAIRRFLSPPTLPPIPYGRTPPEGNSGAPMQEAV